MMRLLLILALLLPMRASAMEMIGFGAGGGLIAPTYFGTAVNPAHSGTLYGPGPRTITPPSDMVTGDLVVLLMSYAYTGTDNAAISDNGGQSWTALATTDRTNISKTRGWWARYDGTWDASPSVVTPGSGPLSILMHVFRPGSGTYTWAEDVADAGSIFSAPGSPYDVSNPSVTTTTEQVIVLAHWTAEGAMSWSLQTAGWTTAGSSTYINYAGGDFSLSSAYKIMANAGASGEVVNRESVAHRGHNRVMAFKQVAP